MTSTERVLGIAEALEIVLAELQPVETESISLADALGRVLAADVTAEVDLPPWTNASMDGYACQAEDIETVRPENPATLPVVETIAAGGFASRALQRGEAMRIMTGAPLPKGADSVVRLEDTDGGIERVAIHDARDARRNLRQRGEDLRAGDVAVTAGTIVRAAEIGMLAAVGAANVKVHKRPRVAILSSGDELADVDDSESVRQGRRIVSANNYSLTALVVEAGGTAVDLGIVRDDVAQLRSAFERAVECDLVVTSGGISVGAFDYTRSALESLGAEITFWRVAMRPGYNTSFGVLHGTPWIGVPGNPVSALVAGEVFVRPAVRRLSGARALFRRRQTVVAAEPISGAPRDALFLRGIVEPSADGLPRARLAGPQGSAILSSSVRADALLIVETGRERVAAGETLSALVLRDDADAFD